jgi:hypothetical protein
MPQAVQEVQNYAGLPQPAQLQQLTLQATLCSLDNVVQRLQQQLWVAGHAIVRGGPHRDITCLSPRHDHTAEQRYTR